MAIIDAQVHLWRKGTPSPPHLATPYLVEDAIRDMDAAGVDGAILHPPASWDPDSNEQAVEAVLAYPEALCDSRLSAGRQTGQPLADRNLETTARHAGLAALFQQAAQPVMAHGWHAGLALACCREGELPLALLAGDWLPLLGQIAARHPGLKLAVDHMGALRGAKGDAAFPNMKELTALAKFPNVAVKFTGGPFYADDAYPFRSLHRHYRAMYDAFGPRRLFWGTDITKMPCSWRQCVTHFQEIDWIPEADKKLIMGEAICDWIGWKR